MSIIADFGGGFGCVAFANGERTVVIVHFSHRRLGPFLFLCIELRVNPVNFSTSAVRLLSEDRLYCSPRLKLETSKEKKLSFREK